MRDTIGVVASGFGKQIIEAFHKVFLCFDKSSFLIGLT